MDKLLLLVLLVIQATHAIPCTAKCYYEDSTATPCWDPYASSYSYQSETGNCLCCPNGTICSTCKTIVAAGPYYKGYQTAAPTPLSCLCTTDAPCQTSGDNCATCDLASGNCLSGTLCSDGSCVKAGQDCPAPPPECTSAVECSGYMPVCADCINNFCSSYACPIGSVGYDCVTDAGTGSTCGNGNAKCTSDDQCFQPPYNCTKCDEQGRCVSHACPNGSCDRDVDGTGACPSSTTTHQNIMSSVLSSSILQELSLDKALTPNRKESGVLSVLGI